MRSGQLLAAAGLLQLLLVAGGGWLPAAEARRRGPPPIKGDDVRRSRRRHRKSSVCHFGRQTYELEALWNPDLSSPFGVMYCVQCECVPIQRKRRVVGRVKCRNIKRHCPKPNCKRPVLPPAECCKICSDGGSGIARSRADLIDDDEPSGKEFAVLMTGRSSLPASNSSALATGRLRLAHRQLTYAFYYELDGGTRPGRLVFFDETNSVVEELPTGDGSDYQRRTQHICGTWRKMPRRYRRKLKSGQLHVGLGLAPPDDETDGDLIVSGRILRYKGAQTEMFSALLAPEPGSGSGAGATAIVSLASQTGGFHLTLVAQGIFDGDGGAPGGGGGQLIVQMGSRADNTSILDETVDVSSATEGEIIVEARTSLLHREMRQLARAGLHVSLFPRHAPQRRLSGVVMPKIGCNVFSALLSGARSAETSPPHTTGSGLATLRLWRDASLQYSVRLLHVHSTVLRISIEAEPERGGGHQRSRPRQVADVLPQYLDGWANGTLHRLAAADVQALLDEQLFINVATERYQSELRGRVTRLGVSEAHEGSDTAIMLTAHNSSAAGVAWLSVDDDCALHYRVQVADLTHGNRRIELVEYPGHQQRQQRVLAEFGGSRAENHISNLPRTTMMRMERGLTVVRVVPLGGGGGPQISSQQARVAVPTSCLPRRRPGNRLGYFNDQTDYDDDGQLEPSFDCEYEGELYEDGSQWDARHHACRVCSCNHGQVVCEPVQCAAAAAAAGCLRLPHVCCPVCSDAAAAPAAAAAAAATAAGRAVGCWLAGRFRPADTSWHPYLPPAGFDKCTTCTCRERAQGGEWVVQCSRVACDAAAGCPAGRWEPPAPDSGACCRRCVADPAPAGDPRGRAADGATAAAPERGQQYDEGRALTADQILAAGGCRSAGRIHGNGVDWHPRIATIGPLPCITCHCRDGWVTCERLKCRRPGCVVNKKSPDTQCCPLCVPPSVDDADDEDELRPTPTPAEAGGPPATHAAPAADDAQMATAVETAADAGTAAVEAASADSPAWTADDSSGVETSTSDAGSKTGAESEDGSGPAPAETPAAAADRR